MEKAVANKDFRNYISSHKEAITNRVDLLLKDNKNSTDLMTLILSDLYFSDIMKEIRSPQYF